MLIGRISECEARIHTGFRSGWEELVGIRDGTRDPQVRQFAESTLITSKGYEDSWLAGVGPSAKRWEAVLRYAKQPPVSPL